REVGLKEDPDGKIYIKDLWEQLRHWYTQNGTLEVETLQSGKTKDIWHDQPHAGDKTVKGANQVFKRFTEIFPNIKRVMETVDQTRVGQCYLSGISLFASFDSCDAISIDTASCVASFNEPINEATTLDPHGYESNEANLPTITQKKNHSDLINSINLYSEINDPEMQHNFTETLNNSEAEEEKTESSTPPPVNHSFKAGDLVKRKSDPNRLYYIDRLLPDNLIEIIEVGKSPLDPDGWVSPDELMYPPSEE
ncbi:hypothetical protein C7H19_25090, partial [Aphanothece hegewaldii CCALA 016]